MIEFPDIGAPDYNGFDETHEDHTDRVTFEDKTIATRRKVTGKTKSWSLVWENMKTKDWNALTNFYDNVVFQERCHLHGNIRKTREMGRVGLP